MELLKWVCYRLDIFPVTEPTGHGCDAGAGVGSMQIVSFIVGLYRI